MGTPDKKTQRTRTYKIVVLGDGGVGKSALTMQYVCHRFLDYHDPTIEDAYQVQSRIDGEPAQLDILDTAGQPEFTAMRDQYMRKGEGFIICYSICDRRSFNHIQEYRNLIDRVQNKEDIPVILVANKSDLQHMRQVSTEEGQAMANQWECPFYETSAALRHFVDDTFHGIIREVRTHEKELFEASEKENKKTTKQPKINRLITRIKSSLHISSS